MLNRNLVFDFDDAIYFSSQQEPFLNDDMSRKRLGHILRISRGVIVSNSNLKEFALRFNNNILVITGPVDCERYFPKKKDTNKNITIGWIGYPGTTPFLEPLSHVFQEVGQHYPNVVIELIGASTLKTQSHNIRIVKWSIDTEVENLYDFDIGIMPLPDNERARGKGGYKLLQYMAIGIPCVASPVGINSVLIKEGVNGYLADSEDEWYEKLQLLINNEALRKSMGVRGREIVEQQYSLQVSTPKLIEFLAKLEYNNHYRKFSGAEKKPHNG
jgi:glycosyltransferase involved in cell wall biosynthesis